LLQALDKGYAMADKFVTEHFLQGGGEKTKSSMMLYEDPM
jgi:hypothetical protein